MHFILVAWPKKSVTIVVLPNEFLSVYTFCWLFKRVKLVKLILIFPNNFWLTKMNTHNNKTKWIFFPLWVMVDCVQLTQWVRHCNTFLALLFGFLENGKSKHQNPVHIIGVLYSMRHASGCASGESTKNANHFWTPFIRFLLFKWIYFHQKISSYYRLIFNQIFAKSFELTK